MSWTFEDLKKKGLKHNYEPEKVIVHDSTELTVKTTPEVIKTYFHNGDVILPICIAQRIPVKPLSVNECWQGRRFKTDAYKHYEKVVKAYLEDNFVPEGKYSLKILWGLSSLNADLDNPCKGFVDILQKKYGFNDRHIYKLTIEKVDVKKGQEFIEFELSLL